MCVCDLRLSVCFSPPLPPAYNRERESERARARERGWERARERARERERGREIERERKRERKRPGAGRAHERGPQNHVPWPDTKKSKTVEIRWIVHTCSSARTVCIGFRV